MANLFAVPDFYRLAFPALLLAFYVICWLAVGRDPKIGVVAPRYEPPSGISPGVARYILTGGSDGTTLAAVLAGLAAKGVVAIQPQAGSYAVSLLNPLPILLPDEAAIVKTLFNAVSTVQPYAESNTAIIGEADPKTTNAQPNNSIPLRPVAVPMRSSSALSEKMVGAGTGAAVGLSLSPESQVVIDPLAATII